jgi:hypothetical protein
MPAEWLGYDRSRAALEYGASMTPLRSSTRGPGPEDTASHLSASHLSAFAPQRFAFRRISWVNLPFSAA